MKIQGTLIFFGIVLLLSLGVAKTIQHFENKHEIQKVGKTEKRFSRWRKLTLNKGEWQGPFHIRNGSSWKIHSGRVLVRYKKRRNGKVVQYEDRPGIHHRISGKEVSFCSITERAILFFKY